MASSKMHSDVWERAKYVEMPCLGRALKINVRCFSHSGSEIDGMHAGQRNYFEGHLNSVTRKMASMTCKHYVHWQDFSYFA